MKTMTFTEYTATRDQITKELLEKIDSLEPAEFAELLSRLPNLDADRCSDATLARMADHCSAAALASMADRCSDATLARMTDRCSDATLARMAARCSAATLARMTALRNMLIPIVKSLDKKLHAAIGDGACSLDMSFVHHECGTTHCHAGWVVTLAGDAGAALESQLGWEMAARLIYESSTGKPCPDFFANQHDGLAEIKRRAGIETASELSLKDAQVSAQTRAPQ